MSQKLPMKAPMAGMYFHVLRDGKIERQGQIIGRVTRRYYLVQWLDWLMGDPGHYSLVDLVVVAQHTWRLYDSAEQMRAAYDAQPGAPKGE